MMFKNIIISLLVGSTPAHSVPLLPRQEGGGGHGSAAELMKRNALTAQQQNALFASIKPADPCGSGDTACVNSAFAQCVNGMWNLTSCGRDDFKCFSVPLTDKPGTSLCCDTQDHVASRIMDAGATGGITGSPHPTPSVSANDDIAGDDCEDEEDNFEDGEDDSDDCKDGECDDECEDGPGDDDSAFVPTATTTSSTPLAAPTTSSQDAPPSSTSGAAAKAGHRRQIISGPNLTPRGTGLASTSGSPASDPASSSTPGDGPITLVSDYSTISSSRPSPAAAGAVTVTVTFSTTVFVSVTNSPSPHSPDPAPAPTPSPTTLNTPISPISNWSSLYEMLSATIGPGGS